MLTLGLSVWGGEEGGLLALGLPGPPPGAQEVTQLCPGHIFQLSRRLETGRKQT